jgi:hypothetical protein
MIVKEKSAITALNTMLDSEHPKRTNNEPHGDTKQAIAMTPVKWSACQIPCMTAVFVILVFGV